jgi:hypothetical protein
MATAKTTRKPKTTPAPDPDEALDEALDDDLDADEALDDAPAPGTAMVDRDHKRGCPARDERIEIYDASKPVRAEDGAILRHERVPVAHCLDCGETVILEATAIA